MWICILIHIATSVLQNVCCHDTFLHSCPHHLLFLCSGQSHFRHMLAFHVHDECQCLHLPRYLWLRSSSVLWYRFCLAHAFVSMPAAASVRLLANLMMCILLFPSLIRTLPGTTPPTCSVLVSGQMLQIVWVGVDLCDYQLCCLPDEAVHTVVVHFRLCPLQLCALRHHVGVGVCTFVVHQGICLICSLRGFWKQKARACMQSLIAFCWIDLSCSTSARSSRPSVALIPY